MSNIAVNARVVCPFFKRVGDNGRTVICEGLARGSDIANCFRGSKQFDQWIEEVCGSLKYADRCLLAQAVEGKYE